jgi:hypothetical protein
MQYSRGLLSFIPAYIIYLLLAGLVPLTYTYRGIYFYYFFYDALFFSFIGAVAYVLVKRFSSDSDRGSISEGFIFLAGFFTFASVLEIVRDFPYYNSYLLFLYPTMRLAVIAALAIVLARHFDASGWLRWAYLALGVVFVAATALVPFLYLIHLGFAAIIVTVLLFAVAVFPYAIVPLSSQARLK